MYLNLNLRESWLMQQGVELEGMIGRFFTLQKHFIPKK